MSVDADAQDPDAPLARITLPILGITVNFESNYQPVIDIAEIAFSAWRIIETSPRLISDIRVRHRIYVDDGTEGPDAHPPITYHQPDHMRVILRTPGSVGVADVARRESVLYTTRQLVADRQHFRYGVLEALTLAILTKLDRLPIHAACIARGDTALLLAGPSGAGKSTIAYAAARAGYKILSEDYVNIQMDPRLRVWGMPGFIHLPPQATRHFPDLDGTQPTLMANGKTKIALSIAEIGAMPALPVAQRAGICVLEKGEGEATLDTLDARTLMELLTSRLDPGFDVFADTIGEAIRILASHGGWRLRVGDDPATAVERIGEMFEVLSGG